MRYLEKLIVLVGLGAVLGLAASPLWSDPLLLKAARPQNTPSSIIGQTATLLPNGKLLLLGGEGPSGVVSTIAIKDLGTGITAPLRGGLMFARAWHSATLLPDRTVLIFGGVGPDGHIVTTAERFDPATGQSQVLVTGGLIPRAHHTATLLTDGHVLFAGGVSDLGEVLGTADLWDSRTSTGISLSANLLIPARDQAASLLPGGEVLLWGGTDNQGAKINFGEIFDPISASFRMQTTPVQPSNQTPIVEASIPANGSEDVPVGTLIAFRFSRPLLVTSVNFMTATLTGPSGALPAKVVPAEDGMLAFITPESPLLAATQYTVSLSGLTDLSGDPLPETLVTFTMEGSADTAGLPFGPGGANNSGANGLDSPFLKLPPLQAPPGVTALAGQSLQLNGFPLEDLRLTVEDQNMTAETDGTGRFLLKGLAAGHHVLFVDGRPASRRGKTYGTYEIGVNITAGKTNVLTYTIWMTELDTAHTLTIPSPTTGNVVVTTPDLPGLELHIPSGTVIRDHDGKVVTQISITPIPLKQPPFPLPNVPVPIYFTIQPGAATLWTTSGQWQHAQLYYPNSGNLPVGSGFDFWNYDPDQKGWYIYGRGSVSSDRKEIIPDPGVAIYEFTGAMVASPGAAPPSGPPPGPCMKKTLPPGVPPPSSKCVEPIIGSGDPGASGGSNASGGPDDPSDGEPVDLATGLFVYTKTDLTLSDVLPVSLTRTYRPADSISRAFGIGTTHTFDIFLVGDTFPYTYAELILPDGGRIRYNRTSSGTGYADAVYVHTATHSVFYGSVMSWNGSGWNIKLKNGTIYAFLDGYQATRAQQAALSSITDRYGNAVTLTRDGNSNLTVITTPSGRWIQLTYDSNYRITQAVDNIGRTVGYTYDSSGRLWTVTDAKGGVTTYAYDSNSNMLTITDPRNITYLTNQYDSNNRVIKQTLADSGTYQFSYTLTSNTSQTHFVTLGSGYTGGGPGVDVLGFRACSGCQEAYTPEISETDVTDQRGYVRKVLFGSNGYITSDTHAYGTSQQETVTYQYFPDNLLNSTTDALSRTTTYVYDVNANTTQFTQLSGTQNAVNTSFTYESTFNQLASVTDPLNHTTNYGHDTSGNLTTITDPLNHQTTFTYNSQGLVASATDSLGNTTKFAYAHGILAETVDPLGRTTTKSIDPVGRVVGVTDPVGASAKIAYDALNEVISTSDAVGNVTSFTYDGNGNMLTLADANSHATAYTYDNMDRLSTRKDALNNSETYTYDAAGNVSTFADRRGKVTSYTYDPLNRRTFAGFGTVTGPPTTYESTITYSYDAGNRLSSVVDSVAGTITPTYDNLDRLTQEGTSQGTVNYTFDAAGRRTSMTVAGQTEINYSYDNANRLTGMTQGTPTSVSFAYDNANRRSSLTLPNGIVVTYSYDSASELTGITYTNGSTTLGNLIYSYDLAGRRTSVGGSYAQVNLPAAISTTAFNANNQLTTLGTANLYYDTNGNMTSDGTNSYTWSARNQLASMNFNNVSFQYDGYGRRTGRTISGVTTNYLYDGANVVQELSGTTVTANLLSGGTDEVFMRTDSNGAANFLRDALGSTIALTNSSGSTLASYAYEPFGKTTVTSGSSANRYEYTGRENDGTGVYFYRARYYSPTLQRFVSEDPIGTAGGINPYAYVGNDPILSVDPLGQLPWPFCFSACVSQANAEADYNIFKIASGVATNPGGQPGWAEMADITTLAQWNYAADLALAANDIVKMTQLAAEEGVVTDVSANTIKGLRDANEQMIDSLLGQAAQEIAQTTAGRYSKGR